MAAIDCTSKAVVAVWRGNVSDGGPVAPLQGKVISVVFIVTYLWVDRRVLARVQRHEGVVEVRGWVGKGVWCKGLYLAHGICVKAKARSSRGSHDVVEIPNLVVLIRSRHRRAKIRVRSCWGLFDLGMISLSQAMKIITSGVGQELA